MRGDRTMFLFVVADRDSSVFAPRDVAGYKAYLRSHFGALDWECSPILDAMQDRPEIYFDRVSQIRLPRWSRGRIGLLGDAAYAPSLLAGQGAALAITGAYVLAGELANAARPEDAFARYEAQLRPFIDGKQKSAYGVGRTIAPKTRVGLTLRNLATHALRIGSVAKLAMSRSLRDDFELPRYEVRASPRRTAASRRAN
jgi:2-polyprenyl-6-methoxyphenol hydroxylase-like FAD-dependent oxidoreductase